MESIRQAHLDSHPNNKGRFLITTLNRTLEDLTPAIMSVVRHTVEEHLPGWYSVGKYSETDYYFVKGQRVPAIMRELTIARELQKAGLIKQFVRRETESGRTEILFQENPGVDTKSPEWSRSIRKAEEKLGQTKFFDLNI